MEIMRTRITLRQGSRRQAQGTTALTDRCQPWVVLKSTQPISADKLADAMGLQFKAEPNPAAGWTQFSWQLAGDAGHAILEIYDGMGRLLQSIQLQGNQGTHLLDTRKLPAGIYSCVLKTAGMQKTVKLAIH